MQGFNALWLSPCHCGLSVPTPLVETHRRLQAACRASAGREDFHPSSSSALPTLLDSASSYRADNFCTGSQFSPLPNHLKFGTELEAAVDGGLAVRQDFKKPLATDREGALFEATSDSQLTKLTDGIRVIATDVDGTLLDGRQQLTERVERALTLAMQQGVEVVLATGKARGPWIADVIPRLGLKTPGVFLQGLIIYDADGTILHERTMSADVAFEIIDLAEAEGLTLVAYCGERILCDRTNEHTDRLIGYGEPIPQPMGSLRSVVEEGKISVHKLLFMADDAKLNAIRPAVERRLLGRASVVNALHGMLELLPLGASKGQGLSRVLERMDVSPKNVLAIGDGENDLEMLALCGHPVAMGNANERLKGIAKHVTASNDNDGVAVALENLVLEPGIWCWD